MSDGIGPLFSLQGRTALVTGGSRGIGRALAVGLAAAGADVVLTSRGEVDETAAEIATLGRRVDIVDVDLSDVDSVRDTASALVAERQIDILVNNAGVIDRNDALSITPEGWRGVLTVNVEALFFLTQAIAAPMLDRRAGKVINLASLLSFEGGLNVASYAASKHAVAGVTRALANEWAGRGVQVNAIAPGYIATDFTEPLRLEPVREAEIRQRIPAGRWGTPRDLVGAAVFLASGASDYVNGHVLVVDGGWTAR